MRITVKAALAALALCAASPALALDPPVAACDLSLPTPDAIACAGYYSGNLLNGSAEDIANQQAAIDSLPGDFQFDGDWNALADNTILTLTNGDQLNFGETMFGLTIIGAHFGNVSGDAGNVSVFWLFDFGTEGADFVTLDDPTGWSNATLYTTGSGVPEPATWAMMLLGFGAAGTAMRRSRRRTTALAQIA